MNIQEVRRQLELAGTRSHKDLGQHFLVDENVLAKILEAAECHPEDTLVEIGPGLGVLTDELVKQSDKVIAFELDEKLAAYIEEAYPGVEVIRGNVLNSSIAVLSNLDSFKVVANIPYQITTPLLRLLLETELADKVTSLTLLIQKEVAERLSAGPGKPGRGYLSVISQCFADIAYIRTVKPGSFYPSPKVDSAVVHIQPRALPSFLQDSNERRAFFKFVHALFQQPRKQLKNVYGGTYRLDAAKVGEIFSQAGLKETARAQELSLEQWYSLYTHRI